MGKERLHDGVKGGWGVQWVGEEKFGDESLGRYERGCLGGVKKGRDCGDFRRTRRSTNSWRKWRGGRGIRVLYSHTMIDECGMTVSKGVHEGALLLLEVSQVREKGVMGKRVSGEP